MIIQYDTRPDATIDEKLRSLIHSIQLALGEVGISTDSKVLTESENKDESIATLQAQVRLINAEILSLQSSIGSLQETISALGTTVSGHTTDISNLDQRVTALEEA